MDDYYSIRLNRWLTSLKIQADTLPACVNCTSIRSYFIYFLFQLFAKLSNTSMVL